VAAALSLTPIAAGKLDEWKELHAELMGPKRIEWAQSQRRRGVTRQVVSLVMDDDRPLAAVFTEAADPDQALHALHESTEPFDRWLVERLGAVLDASMAVIPVIDTAPRPGPWRGWRR
jgi:hypothetical protein